MSTIGMAIAYARDNCQMQTIEGQGEVLHLLDGKDNHCQSDSVRLASSSSHEPAQPLLVMTVMQTHSR